MNTLPLADLLAPLDDGAPCGLDLEYDPAFQALEELAAGKPEQQFGDTLIAAQEPDWREVHAQALALLARTRDLRLAVLLARSGARHLGLGAYVEALALVAGWLEAFWDSVHPQLDHEDDDDPTMRLNALMPLVDLAAGLADLRSARIGSARPPLTVRYVELSTGRILPHAGEAAPSREGIAQALAAAQAQGPETAQALRQGHVELARIDAVLTERVGGGLGPDLRPLAALLKCLDDAAAPAAGGSDPDASATGPGPAAATGDAPAAAGVLRHREDVVRSLEAACLWIEQHEPSNPAPLLIRRAQRLMHKNFMDIIRDLAPDGLDQIERIAGTVDE